MNSSAPAGLRIAVQAWDESWLGGIARSLWSPVAGGSTDGPSGPGPGAASYTSRAGSSGTKARPGEGLTLVFLVLLAALSTWAFNISGGLFLRVVAVSVSLGVIVSATRSLGLFLVLASLPFVPDAVALTLVTALVVTVVVRRLASADWRVGPWVASLVRETRAKLGTGVLLLALLLFVATITSVDQTGSLRYLLVWFVAIGLYWTLIDLAGDSTAISRAALALGVTAALAGVFALYQVAVHVPPERAWIDVSLFPEIGTRVFAFWGNPNVFALHLLLTGPLLAAALWTAGGRLARALVGLGVIVVGLALVLTLSRSGWFGLAVAIIFLGLLRDARIIFVGLLAALAATLVTPEVVLARAATLVRFDDPTAVHRIRIWESSARMIADFWWSGLGLGWRSFQTIYPQYAIGGRVAFHAHSHYLQTLVELGVIGFAALHLVLLRPLWWTLRLARKARGSPAGTILITATAAIAGSLAFGLAEPIFYLPRLIIITWAVLGLATAARRSLAADRTAGAGAHPEPGVRHA